MFDLDNLISGCVGALDEASPQLAIKDILSEVVSDPSSVERALAFTRAELSPLFTSPELTILNLTWAPAMVLPPHDHRMWALIGIYGGEEANTFFRRTPDGIVESGGRQLCTSDVALLGSSTIHSVANTSRHDYTGAIHIYGGDFMHKPRSMWDPESMEEQAADGETLRQLFEDANAKAAGA